MWGDEERGKNFIFVPCFIIQFSALSMITVKLYSVLQWRYWIIGCNVIRIRSVICGELKILLLFFHLFIVQVQNWGDLTEFRLGSLLSRFGV